MGYWRGSSDPAYPNRVPANKAVNVSINAYTLAQWVGPPTAYFYKTYLNGQNSGLIDQYHWFYSGIQWFPTLAYSTSYSWYVEAYASNGTTVIATAPTWTFTVESGPPSKPTTPTPANNATEVDFSGFTLSWVDGGGADTYDVYIGPSGSLVKVSSSQAGTSYVTNIAEVPYNQVIYWRIDAINEVGTTEGDTWNFDARPGKPTNPTPTNTGTGIKLSLATLTWESGS